ncbi:MAG: hypothetical protein LBP35_03955 [Candidatus Ancillula trichonymphae]|nr:hypothetical protein [Candidatus Ancillula trichonymphae]
MEMGYTRAYACAAFSSEQLIVNKWNKNSAFCVVTTSSWCVRPFWLCVRELDNLIWG